MQHNCRSTEPELSRKYNRNDEPGSVTWKNYTSTDDIKVLVWLLKFHSMLDGGRKLVENWWKHNWQWRDKTMANLHFCNDSNAKINHKANQTISLT